jgi:predicted Zn-ribbon and HTH transcriptional regulator
MSNYLRSLEEDTSRADGLEELEGAELDPNWEELAIHFLNKGIAEDILDCPQSKHLWSLLERIEKARRLLGNGPEVLEAMARSLKLPDCPWCGTTLEIHPMQLACRCPHCKAISPNFPDAKTLFPCGERNPAAVRRFLISKYK